MAEAAPAHCGTCGFLLRVAGPLAAMFGVCANASSPSDGRAVSLDHGCGAHSDVRAEQAANLGAQGHVHDTITWDAFGDSDVEVIRR
jgi:hypothetical protein